MSLIDQFLETHPLSKDMPFLWTLRLSPEEYTQLKEYIRANVVQGRFSAVKREAALFYAEWWRREHKEGHPSKRDVCISVFGQDDWQNSFFDAAREGARSLGLQIIRSRGEQREASHVMFSLLYQGGLPMNRITNEILNNGARTNWNTFFKKLVWDDLDYELIPGNAIASKSDSIRAFCDTLRRAEHVLDAPFSPAGEGLIWWRIVERNFLEEKKATNARNPFQFKWLIEMNENQHVANVSFSLKGPQRLSPDFIENHRLSEQTTISVSIHINGTSYPLAEFNKNENAFYSRRAIDKAFKCSIGDVVELVLNEGFRNSEILDRRSLDLSDPKILKLEERTRNAYTLANPNDLSSRNCLIACTENWKSVILSQEVYLFGTDRINVMRTTPDDIPLYLVTDNGERKTLDPEKHLLHTTLDESLALNLSVSTKERLFHAPNSVVFSECGAQVRRGCDVLYAAKGSQEWRKTAPLGLIRAKARRDDNESVDPVQFFNVGSLSVECFDSSRDSCKLRIEWPHGRISCDFATTLEDNPDVWFISRESLADTRYAPFTFHPARQEPFTLHFLIPFHGFQIYDYHGNETGDKSLIPIVDLDGFRYYLRPDGKVEINMSATGGRDPLKYEYLEAENSSFVRVSERIADLPARTSYIPIEGRLSSLFMDGNEQVAELMDRQTAPLPDAGVTVRVTYGNTRTYRFKDFPYRLNCDGNQVCFHPHPGLPLYPGTLQAIPFDAPEQAPVSLIYIDKERFGIPDVILGSEHRNWLIFGDIKGYVLPKSFSLPDNMEEGQAQSRSVLLSDLKNDLLGASLFSPAWKRALSWFDNLQHSFIPGSSILELVAIADDWNLLCKFALHLYVLHCKTEEEQENLAYSLLDFQKQLYFLWSWIRISKDEIEIWLNDAWETISEKIKPYYYKWVISKHEGDNLMEYLTNEERIVECREDFIAEFISWMEDLISKSIPQQMYLHPDIRQNGGDERLSEHARRLFEVIRNEMKETFPETNNLAPNDLWICERRFLDYKLRTKMNLGDLGESEAIKTEIKKTVIHGLKFQVVLD